MKEAKVGSEGEGKKEGMEVDKKGVYATLCQIFQKVEAKKRMMRYRMYMTRLIIPVLHPRS